MLPDAEPFKTTNAKALASSPWRIAATVMVLVCVLFASVVPLSGNDFWLQTRIGELIVQEHHIPDTLLFPFTEAASKPFHAHEWLCSLVFYWLMQMLGEAAMPLVNGLLGLLLFAACARLAYVRGGNNFALALLGGMAAMLAENYRHELRPELPALLLMALFWNLLDTQLRHPGRRNVALLLLTMLLWANCHGSFILGPVLAGLIAAGIYLEQWKTSQGSQWKPGDMVWQWLLLSASLLGVCCVNPQGWNLVLFVFQFGSDTQAQRYLTEWIPTLDHRLHGLRGWWVGLGVWLVMAGVLLARLRTVRMTDLLLFVFFSLLALKAIRFPIYLGMLFAYLVPAYIAQGSANGINQDTAFKAITALACVLLALTMQFGNVAQRRPYFYDDPTKLTRQMVSAISNPELQGNVLNSMELGAELVYRAYPRLRPAIDSRFDSYGYQYQDEIYAVLKSDAAFEKFVARYDVRYILIDGSRFKDLTHLQSWNRKEWRIYSMDHKAVLFQRADVREGSPAD